MNNDRKVSIGDEEISWQFLFCEIAKINNLQLDPEYLYAPVDVRHTKNGEEVLIEAYSRLISMTDNIDELKEQLIIHRMQLSDNDTIAPYKIEERFNWSSRQYDLIFRYALWKYYD